MKNTIKCAKCGAEIEISEALRRQMEDSVREEEAQKYASELAHVKEQATKEAEEASRKKIREQEEHIESLKKRAESAEDEERKIRKEKIELAEAKEKFEIEKERQLDREREKIREEAKLQTKEEDKLKFAEYEKKLSDMADALEQAKYKGAQGSQQLQGEVLELEFETLLANTFADDEIVPVAKGKRGGDVVQKVKGKSGRVAGIILWETKRAKWSPSWASKLREDARAEGATFAVLVATELPRGITNFAQTGGIIVTSYAYAIALAGVLRRSILHIAVAKQTAENKDESLEMLYEYFQSEAFRHRFEAFAEGVQEMQADLDYEKRAMERVWKKREVQIKKTMINASRMYGELQGIMSALPDIKALSLPGGEKK